MSVSVSAASGLCFVYLYTLDGGARYCRACLRVTNDDRAGARLSGNERPMELTHAIDIHTFDPAATTERHLSCAGAAGSKGAQTLLREKALALSGTFADVPLKVALLWRERRLRGRAGGRLCRGGAPIQFLCKESTIVLNANVRRRGRRHRI
jgi:hypothetical protein